MQARLVFSIASVLLLVGFLAASCNGEDTPQGPSCQTDESGCSCSFGNANNAACKKTNDETDLCCASEDWPNAGSCNCQKVSCVEDEPLTCRCGRGLSGSLDLCGGVLCCRRPVGDCYCKRPSAIPPKCSADEESVAYCLPGNNRCPPGQKAVDACNGG